MKRKLRGSWALMSVVEMLCVGGLGVGCSGGDSDDLGTRDAASGERDAASATPDAGEVCPRSEALGALEITIEIPDGVDADVTIRGADGEPVGEVVRASETRSLPGGPYTITARRVREPGELVGAAYQPEVRFGAEVCIHAEDDDEPEDARVVYAREPGSARLWLTQSNGSGPRIMAFDASQVAERGEQTPSVGLDHDLPNSGPLRIDGLGRLWVGSNTGSLIAYDTAALGESSNVGPDVTLTGGALCEAALPCGPRALAFDAQGALYVATLTRIVKLAPGSLAESAQPTAAVTISSPDIESPSALAFDARGNLWVGETSGAIVRFDAARLTGDITDERADVVIYAGTDTPVAGLFGSPEGLVFDAEGALWVGYFTGNDLVRFSAADLAASASSTSPLIPSTHVRIGVEALVTDLALDEAGNLWLPGGQGALYTIAASALSDPEPALESLTSAEIGSVERIAFNSVPGATFIAP